MEKEFAFDVKLAAVVRVSANSEKAARAAMERVLQACEPTGPFLDGFNAEYGHGSGIRITEFSLDPKEPNLFEVNGKKATSALNCRHSETGGGICLDCGHDTIDDEEGDL